MEGAELTHGSVPDTKTCEDDDRASGPEPGAQNRVSSELARIERAGSEATEPRAQRRDDEAGGKEDESSSGREPGELVRVDPESTRRSRGGQEPPRLGSSARPAR